MKFISWNVNGFKACLRKGFEKFFNKINADFFCTQETKLSEDNQDFTPYNYYVYQSNSERKGYSGVMIFTKHEPLSIIYGLNNHQFDCEGRIITLEYDNFYLVNIYTPNSKSGFLRLDFRADWEESLRDYLQKINNRKPLIVCGDFNAARLDIDSKIPRSEVSKGFTEEDRSNFCEMLEYTQLQDTYRLLHPNSKDKYTWWSYSRNKRDENSGSRIDYFLISEYFVNSLKSSEIYADVIGSDHCPIGMELEI